MIIWNISKADLSIVEKIVNRAIHEHLINIDEWEALTMAITAVHLNDFTLDLNKLLNAEIPLFLHDIVGIKKFINRETGTLNNFFVPRCTTKSKSSEKKVSK